VTTWWRLGVNAHQRNVALALDEEDM